MPDTMLGRIARALYERFPHGQLVTDARGLQALSGIPWDDLGDASRQRWFDDARTALTAMRDFPDKLGNHLPTGYKPGSHSAREIWNSIIDGALEEG